MVLAIISLFVLIGRKKNKYCAIKMGIFMGIFNFQLNDSGEVPLNSRGSWRFIH